MTDPKPKAPPGLGRDGRRLWRAIVDAYSLEDHERELLAQACRTADAIADLQAVVDVDGVLAESSQGVRAHPALVEARQQRIALARQMAALRLPDIEPDEDTEPSPARPQRRAGTRGVYAIAGGAS